MTNSDKWMPEIFYEENNSGITNGLPFVKIPEDKEMPSSIFLCGVRDIKDEEEQKDLTIHMYVNMSSLKQKLDAETLDKVRLSLGLKPLLVAQEEGRKITESINNNISNTA